MLIALCFFIVNVLLPQIAAYAQAFVELILVIVITMAGIVMLFGAVGMKISNNLGSTVVSGIFQAIGYTCRTIIKAIGWIARNIFKMIPSVFNESRRTFRQIGANELISNLLAVLVVIIFLAIII